MMIAFTRFKFVIWCSSLFVHILFIIKPFITSANNLDLWPSSFNFKIYGVEDTSPFFLSARNVSNFDESAVTQATIVCEHLPDSVDLPTCIFVISNTIRLTRISSLQRFIAYGYIHENPHKASILDNNEYVKLRTRENEMLSILRHFDGWDLDSQDRHICMVGSDVRLHLLVTFLSFKTVKKVTYVVPTYAEISNKYFTRDQCGNILDFISTPFMSYLAERFPSGKVIELSLLNVSNPEASHQEWSQYADQCSLILLPSDYESIHLGKERMNALVDVIFPDEKVESYVSDHASLFLSDSSTKDTPIIWITDHIHDLSSIVKIVNISEDTSVYWAEGLIPLTTRFQWFFQDTWKQLGVLFNNIDQEADGFSRYISLVLIRRDIDVFALNSVYLGQYKQPREKLLASIQTVESQPPNLNPEVPLPLAPISKKNVVVLLTYQDRIYTETAEGLYHQLTEELQYPHVLVIPLITWEIMDYIAQYLKLSCTTAAADDDSFSDPNSIQEKAFHVVQIILTPHWPAAHLVPSTDYSSFNCQEGHQMRVTYNYIVMQMEQQWFFELSPAGFTGSIPLLNMAIGVWTFSPVQQESVRFLYNWQVDKENLAIQREYYLQNRSQVYPSNYYPPYIQRQERVLQENFIDIVPIFAPCRRSFMPCHPQFTAPNNSRFSTIEKYQLLYFGHSSANRVQFLSSLRNRLQSKPWIDFQIYSTKLNKTSRDINTTIDDDGEEPMMTFIGGQRDAALLSRASIVLNVRAYNDSVLEMHRLVYLLSMGKCVISQRGRDPSLVELPALRGAVHFVDTVEEVEETLTYLLTPTPEDTQMDTPHSEDENLNVLRLRYLNQSSNAWKWINHVHGSYRRLAHCERRSLQAYHLLHRLHREDLDILDDISADSILTNTTVQIPYGSIALANAMNRLRNRLAATYKIT